jgi:hypothetical protein
MMPTGIVALKKGIFTWVLPKSQKGYHDSFANSVRYPHI